MLTKNDLQELLDYQAQSPILSVYLNTNPTGGTIEDHKLQLRSMLKDIDAPKDIEIIKTYLDHEYDWRSWADENFFQAYPLAVDVRSRARLHHCPYVKPLAALFDAHSGYGVVLIDKQQARFSLGRTTSGSAFFRRRRSTPKTWWWLPGHGPKPRSRRHC